jgi:hypothetical protein
VKNDRRAGEIAPLRIANPLMKTHATFGRFRLEIRAVTDSQSHRSSPFTVMWLVGHRYGRLLASQEIGVGECRARRVLLLRTPECA